MAGLIVLLKAQFAILSRKNCYKMPYELLLLIIERICYVGNSELFTGFMYLQMRLYLRMYIHTCICNYLYGMRMSPCEVVGASFYTRANLCIRAY